MAGRVVDGLHHIPLALDVEALIAYLWLVSSAFRLLSWLVLLWFLLGDGLDRTGIGWLGGSNGNLLRILGRKELFLA